MSLQLGFENDCYLVEEAARNLRHEDTVAGRLLSLQRLHNLVDGLSEVVYSLNVEQVNREANDAR